ncbi:nuclear pore complex protein Nup98-Nup96 isoform X2 [Diabrotica virgifera virgifera]|uniref:Nuclear pore complex protein Nup98-Nup96 n=1 Tax=Diabrotica virgifera virgifera TaxID=50390 RepID=A0ABM5KQN9_DIAVI|nr:nuclear pore complex protein Nup98-Nup96 isoform X2 [Diabrotica virgifera virgifera]
MFGKSAFGTGAPTTSFGFGTTTAAAPNPFGTGQLFGKPAGGFGSPSTSAFGQPATTSLFPSSQAQPNNLFQNAGTGFGTPASTPSTGFGTTTLFGQQQQPAAGGLFNTSSTFGQQNKPAAFGFGAQPAQPTLFGQQAAQPQTSGMFQPSTSNLFGTTSAFGQQSTGTGGVKFNAVTGTDTMLKNGVSNSINTKLHSITCMKDYESKSFEELRYEDYAANRKGPQQQSGFGATPFGNQVSSAAPSLFGQPDASKPAFTGFGQSTSTFGQNTGFGMPNQQQQTGGLFGKPATGFATPTSTSSLNFGFGSNTQTNNPFGAAQQPKAFGSVTPSIFGTNTATTQQSGFNTGGGLFGQTNTQNTAGSIFGKPAQPTVGFGTAPNANFSFSTPAASTQASSLFQPNKPIFGQTSTTPAFGQATNTFGTNTFGSTLGKPAAPAFGTTPTPAFGNTLGTGLQPQAAPLFGNNAVKPGGFFNNTGTTGLGTFQSNTFPTNTGFNLQPQAAQQSLFPSAEQQTATNLALLTADPFGDAPHLAGLEPKLKSSPAAISATDPKELKSLLDASNKVTTSTGSKLRVVPIRSIKDSLFDLASPPVPEDSKDYIKTNCRKLVLKSRPSSGESNSPAVQRMDILKHLESPDTPINDENVNIQNIRYSTTLQNEIRPHVKLNFENTINNDSSLPIGSPTFILDNSVRNSSHENIQKNNRVSVEVDIEPTESGGSGDCVKSYPCNIVCTRPEYYTLPPPEELMKYVDEDGRCIVKGFTIGRKGYGNVYFPEEMDVSGLNLDEFVHFRYREINIYPDDDKKPPIGQGLNRKAQVTLDNVYPKRPGSNTLVKDINELQLMNFSEKLRKVTENKDAKFVDYRPETGSWVFKVDHFSRYGYDESDDEAAPLNKEAAEKKAAEKAAKVVTVPKPVEKQVEKEAVEKTSPTKSQVPKFGLDDDIFVEEGAHFQPEDDLIETAMYVDNISEEDYHVIPTDMPLHLTHDPFTSCKNIQVMKSTLFAEDDRSSDGGGSHISIIRQYLDIPEEIRRMPVVREECPPKKRIMLRPKVEKVYNYGKKEGSDDLMEIRSYQDMGIFRGKSYKVGWSKGFNFYNVVSKPEGGIQLTLNDIKCGSIKNFEAIDEILGKSLEIVLEESSYELDSNNVPTFTITKNARYLKKQSNLFSTLLERHNTKEARYLHSIWTLADSLWGPSENTVSNRRYLLSEWLRMNTNYDEPSQEPAQEIFNNLSVFKINEAANLAIDKRLPNLSLILSQLSLTNRTKMFLQEQIESWYQSMSSNHISEDMKRIYLLLSGIPVKDEVNIFENIDWKRAFGMHMWYVSPSGAPIEMVIELYKKAFEEYNYAELPNPPYESTYAEENSFDLLYHILVLYQSRAHRLSTVLNSATHTDNHLDYWLSWLLLQLFLSLDVGIMDDAEKNKLCSSFSNQLESLGEWEWSILVLLHLKDNALKKTLVMQILDRNLSPDVDKEGIKSENNLVNNMQIPPEWIHRVKGEKTLLSQRYFEAFNHFAYAKDYCKANDILVEHLLPSLFINEQYDIIKLLIREIEDGSADIEHWNSEAGLFKDFMELQERYVSASDNLKLQMNLQDISNRISSFVPRTNQQKLCIAEMSKRCASVYKEFCKKSQSSLFRNSYLEFIESLNMPPEFKQNEALYSINEIGAKC